MSIKIKFEVIRDDGAESSATFNLDETTLSKVLNELESAYNDLYLDPDEE